ncbi:MAG: hypothetical protein KKG60_03835 [Nanoarchaeota archaeon]|nr:hypothetical protein [Nanoarchaeota archaeon]
MENENLVERFKEIGYWSDLGWHSEEKLIEKINEILSLNPSSLEYWQLKSAILGSVSQNAMEQFSRGKYPQGLNTKRGYELLESGFVEIEEKSGIDISDRYF